jgi:hypothetical protein
MHACRRLQIQQPLDSKFTYPKKFDKYVGQSESKMELICEETGFTTQGGIVNPKPSLTQKRAFDVKFTCAL